MSLPTGDPDLTKLRLLFERAKREQLRAETAAYERRRERERAELAYREAGRERGCCVHCENPLGECACGTPIATFDEFKGMFEPLRAPDGSLLSMPWKMPTSSSIELAEEPLMGRGWDAAWEEAAAALAGTTVFLRTASGTEFEVEVKEPTPQEIKVEINIKKEQPE